MPPGLTHAVQYGAVSSETGVEARATLAPVSGTQRTVSPLERLRFAA